MKIPFGEYALDSDSRQLRRGREVVALSPKAFQLLQVLLDSRPKALSKATLHRLLWPDTVVVEANLSNLIGEIRAALGEDTREPRFIRTLHRFGYAFSGEAPAAAEPLPSHLRLTLRWPGGRALLADGEHVIGRDPDLAVCLTSGSVSRRHALIRVSGGQVTVEDLGSKNGTWLNDERVTVPRALVHQDDLRVGSISLTVHVAPAFGSTETGVGSNSD